MRRKIILFGGLFFLVSLLVMGTKIGSVRAEEDPCHYVRDCLVPAPTIVVPELDSSAYPDSLVIAGLSWNETLVDIYIDGVYNGRAELNLDDSGVANFAYKTFLPLTPGDHSVYTVARNLNAKERSVESFKIVFSIIARPIATSDNIIQRGSVTGGTFQGDIIEGVADDQVENKEEVVGVTSEGEDVDISVAPEEEGRVNVNGGGQIEGGVWSLATHSTSSESSGLEEGQTEEAVSDLQKTVDRDQIIDEFFSEDAEIFAEQRNAREEQNRQIGFAMLGVIIVISIVWVIISSRSLPNVSDVSHDARRSQFLSRAQVEMGGLENKDNLIVRQEPRVVKSVPKQEKTEDAMDDELDRLV